MSTRPALVVAHAGDSNDLDYLRAIGDTGAVLGFDRFNIPHFNPDEDRIRTLLALLEEGYGDRIHLSHDAACFMDFMVGDPNFADERPDYLHLTTRILPGAPRQRRHRRADRRADDRQSSTLPRAVVTDVTRLGVAELSAHLQRRELSAGEVTAALLARIREVDGEHSHDG